MERKPEAEGPGKRLFDSTVVPASVFSRDHNVYQHTHIGMRGSGEIPRSGYDFRGFYGFRVCAYNDLVRARVGEYVLRHAAATGLVCGNCTGIPTHTRQPHCGRAYGATPRARRGSRKNQARSRVTRWP